ncbi:sialidase family protein [uncultured Acetatifactor sp.]|uniref:sialidase family protein n=1 Tax=uncultured Acetatifactor sp. TaxID=1671927 RepID=UPI0026123F74|nr:sialidase family protein [uncultured Acetatifactor sp.]
MKKTIVMDNICGWPNLTVFPDGSILSTVFNQPTHGMAEGEVECLRSTDQGESWHRYGIPAMHEPTKNRMNVACGLAADGDFLAVVGGWDNRVPVEGRMLSYPECNRLPAVVCRSRDGGRTFSVADFQYRIPGNPLVLVPYGDVVQVGERLAVACYTCSKDMKETSSYIAFSDDDGHTWTSHGVISESGHHETALWFADERNGIAMARSQTGDHLDQFVTDDGGLTWRFDKQVTCDGIHPGHILELADGRLLLSCGIRLKNNWGIGVAQSRDQGASWSWLAGLCNFGQASDGGYPASVQLADGSILTHYYISGVPFCERYFVGQVHWELDELF